MKNTKLLTIGIPTFNGEQYLKETIESILSQLDSVNSDLIEILISDNASTNRTQKIIEYYNILIPNLFSYYKNDSNLGCDQNVDMVFISGKNKESEWVMYY